MFGKDFYPTPESIIQRMLTPYEKTYHRGGINGYQAPGYGLLNGLTILEPSAGKGNILDYIREHSRDTELYCCELHPELRYILQEKDYRVIGSDFLAYQGDYLMDLIIMNPPFRNADQHLLKAWEVLEEGKIICLLNSETVNNPYTERRKLLLSIIEQHGEVEEIGAVFETGAERNASVDCTIVRLHKLAEKQRLHFSFENVTPEPLAELKEETFRDQVATRDVIGNMMIQYQGLKDAFVEYLKARERMEFYSQGLFQDSTGIVEVAEKAVEKNNRYGDGPSKQLNKHGAFNRFCDETKQQLWGKVLSVVKMEQYLTHQVRQNFKQFAKHQGYLDFTVENVAHLLEMIVENRHTIMEQAITDVFDLFTQYHSQNRCHVEGWKTNDRWKVNRKIIMPYWISFGDYDTAEYYRNYGSRFETSYSRESQYNDIDKVLCYLKGIPYQQCRGIYRTLRETFYTLGKIKPGDRFDNTCSSEFFDIRFFKKGTIHLEFRDIWLWEEFNLRACAGKQWLPEAEMNDVRKHTSNTQPQEEPRQLALL